MIFYIALTFTILAAGVIISLLFYGIQSTIEEYRADRVPVLLYHHFISKEKVAKGELINPGRVYFCYDTAFDEQMAHLHREGYTTISLGDFLAFQAGERPLPSKPIILTFDDGFMSNYLYAFPILKKYRMKATIFVTPDQESDNFKKYASLDLPLTHQQMREMSDYGISIESHGMTHRYLSEMEPEAIRHELEESKRVLEGILKKPVQFLAIPSGAYNKTVRQLVKEAGYKAAFCMLKGTNNARSDRYTLRRLVIARDFTLEDFKSILTPAIAFQLRITSVLQNFLFNTLLGPARCDALRDTLYSTRLASSLIRGQLRYFVAGLAAAVIIILILSINILLH